MISGDHCPEVVENVHAEMLTTNSMTVLLNSKDFMTSMMFSARSEEIKPERATVERFMPHRFASASAPATSSTPLPTVPGATPIEGKHFLIITYGHVPNGRTATTRMTDVLLALHNAVDHLIAKHPKVLSTVSTVLTFVGGIIALPAFSECARGTILARPGVALAGGIAVAVGKWLRRAMNSAAALAAAQVQAQVQASGQVTIEDV